MTKYVYLFNEGNAKMRNLLGGKGANLAEMTTLGLPVPRGFTVTTEACLRYYEDGEQIGKDIEEEILKMLDITEKTVGKKLGDPKNPFLVSVRSGSRASMPGMMDTVLNLGLNDEVVEGLAKLTNNPRFAYDSYRRFVMMFSDVVIGLSKSKFERILDDIKEDKGIVSDTDLTADDMKFVLKKFKEMYKKEMGKEFPQDPKEQLFEAIKAVFRSWNNERAIYYRRMNDIPSNWGTAVNVQEMVYGNMGEDSGTGVAFTRNPSTGEKKLMGEYLMNAQGEDVVAGVRTPYHIDHLEETNKEVYDQFMDLCMKLENHYRDMQDIEFTIERGKLFILQTRNGKRTAHAALKIAVDLVKEGLLTKEEALLKVDPKQLDALLHPMFDDKALKAAKVIGTGLAASPGAAAGRVVFCADDAKEMRKKTKDDVILVRLETSPEDIEGMNISQGILTARGGMTSHAAVVARGMGRCCVSGCTELKIDEHKKEFSLSGKTYKTGDWISLDGSTGKIYGEKVATKEPELSGDFATLMSWADEVRTLKVRANADNPADAKQAVSFGAEGIGLCRTEHMFFEADRIRSVRQMILADTKEQREEALNKILPMQRGDFEGIFTAMEGRPVTIRFLDPPLHEFLPKEDREIKELAEVLKVKESVVRAKIDELHEINPMMGHRGCRLSVTYPEIAVMQTTAIIEAAINVSKKGIKIEPELMIPLISEPKEFAFVKKTVVNTANRIIKDAKVNLKYTVGTMIEIPRAAILADEIAKEAEFFSFGTNDMTQMTYGFSRDDATKFLGAYYDLQILESDPFARLDQKGVGKLVKMAADLGRATRKDIKLGICGEHGADPSTIEFCYLTGLDYVSCSPFRVPIARLAAAQAVINNR
ncbi:MAG TPA: pyruvate, phosphate dikinase [Clostridia bacterium]|nr:pyruvate, phosphate dikinase [Clostridia bacterium]HOR88965.1 pyruvate, phosphate dikinase [Clostridia bacterium]HPL07291.1 pyruvate, phosphate dikinase [Clostridia bacterium]